MYVRVHVYDIHMSCSLLNFLVIYQSVIPYSEFFKGENFHETISIHENLISKCLLKTSLCGHVFLVRKNF